MLLLKSNYTFIFSLFLLLNELNYRTAILYLHVKGMRNNGDSTSVADWRRYMVYFLANRWEICLSLLQPVRNINSSDTKKRISQAYHTCGVQMNLEEYAGNMWWSTAEWIQQLKGVHHLQWNMANRYEAEDFLFRQVYRSSNRIYRRSYCLFEIQHNMYDCPTPNSLYTGNNSIPLPLITQNNQCYRPPNIEKYLKSQTTECYSVRLATTNNV